MGVDRVNGKGGLGSGGAAIQELESNEDFVDYVRKQVGVGVEVDVTAETENLSGNINRVRRVRFQSIAGSVQSYVVKHVPKGGQLERYPTIIFPESRLSFEARWFHFCSGSGQSNLVKTPKIVHFGNGNRTLIMEDLKPRMTLGEYCQRGGELKAMLAELGSFLIDIHRASIGGAIVPNNPTAALNRPFAFSKPIAEPEVMCELWRAKQNADDRQSDIGISLSEQIQFQQDYLRKYAGQVLPVLQGLESSFTQCSEPVLTHGDLHTDSILILENNDIAVIDAELCDYGPAGFDLGTLCAHIWAELASIDSNQEKIFESLAWLVSGYTPNSSIRQQSDCVWLLYLLESTAQHCGAEILRRLLGAAGFNIRLTMSQRQYLLEVATRLLLEPREYCQKWASILVSYR